MDTQGWRRVEALYHAALEKEPHERDAYLHEACQGDEELRQQVESLLRQDVSRGGVLDRPAWEGAESLLGGPQDGLGSGPGHATDPRDLTGENLSGQALSHYKIVAKLGRGGMGVVYKAEDTKLGRTVALKFLAEHLVESDEHKERFLREARATASLDHPNICMVHEVGEAEGRVYLAIGYVDGPEISARIQQGPLKLDEALDIAIQAAEGLREAHQKGIVHRDIKSSNLMLTSSGQVKIMDFGLAQLSGSSRLTQSDTVLGTPAYMSPEQAQGEATDRRTDIWSLGVVLYEMVTGRLPFIGERQHAVVYSIINKPHEPITGIRAGVPFALDLVVDKALAKEPAERYQHLDDMLVDLRALRGQPPGSARLSTAPLTRRKILWGGVGAVAAASALVVGLNRDRFGSLGIVGRAPRIASIAVLPLANFSGDPDQEYFSDGLTDTLIANLAKIGDLRVISRTSVMRYKGTDKPLPEIAGELGVDAVLEGSAQRSGDRVRITAQLIDPATDEHVWAETYERPMADVLRAQSEVARAIAAQINVTLSPEREALLAGTREVNPEVYEAYLRGMFYVSQNTPEGFEKGLQYLHRAVEIDPAEPLAYAGLADGYVTMGHGGGERLDIFPRARAAAEQALKLEPNRADAVGALAYVALYYEWDWEKAERLFRRALKLNPSLAMTHYHYAWYLAIFDRLDEAIAEHRLARDHDPLRPLHTAWLGGIYNFAGRYDEGIVEAQKALELNPSFWPSYYVLRYAYSLKGLHDEAIAAAQRLADLVPAMGLPSLGTAYAMAGRRQEALEVAAKMDEGNGGAVFLFMAPQLYAALRDHDRALRLLEASYEIHSPFVPWIRVRGGEFEELRDEPRFQQLLRRMNLPL